MGDSTNKQNNETITVHLTKKTIALIILGISALLAFIGVFGTIIGTKSNFSGISDSADLINLEFIFKKGWDNIRNIKDLGANGALLGFYTFQVVMTLVSFILALLGTATIIGINIFKLYNKKDSINIKKSFSLMSVFSLQYVVLVNMINFTDNRRYSTETMQSIFSNTFLGWGSILIIISFFVGLIALILNNSRDDIKITGNILSKLGVIILFFVAIFGLTKLATYSVTNSPLKQITRESNFQALTEILVFDDISSTVKNYNSIKTNLIFSVVFSLISYISLMLCLYNFISNEAKTAKKETIYYSTFYLISIILAGVLNKVAYDKAAEGTASESIKCVSSLGSSTILGIVLGVILLIISITIYKLKDKNIKFSKN